MSLKSNTSSALEPRDIARLLDIFNKHGWKVDKDLDETENHRVVFERFCDLLYSLDNEEKDLILQLTEDFLHCRLWDYPSLLKKSLLQIPSNLISESNEIFLTRLISAEDKIKTKSSSVMTYICLREVMPKLRDFSTKNIRSYDEPDGIHSKHDKRKNSLIILLDDFIGSGDTALKALDYYNNHVYKESDTVIIVSLVAQLAGIVKIENAGYKVFYAELRDKAISDSTSIPNKFKALKILRRIEKRMNVSRDYRLGYNNSQSLVSMIRTPNNTLPIYWWKKNPNGEEWDGIFRR